MTPYLPAAYRWDSKSSSVSDVTDFDTQSIRWDSDEFPKLSSVCTVRDGTEGEFLRRTAEAADDTPSSSSLPPRHLVPPSSFRKRSPQPARSSVAVQATPLIADVRVVPYTVSTKVCMFTHHTCLL